MNEVYGLLSVAEEMRAELLINHGVAPNDRLAAKITEIEGDIAALRYALNIMARNRVESAHPPQGTRFVTASIPGVSMLGGAAARAHPVTGSLGSSEVA